MDQMKILHVISSMAQESGGPPGICAGMAGGLAKRGHAVTIATVEGDRRSMVAIPEGVTVKFFPAAQGSYCRSPAMGAWLNAQVRTFDMVHLHSLWQYPTFAAARACWKAKVPYVVLLNGMLDEYSVTHKSALKKRVYWMLREGRVQRRAAGLQCSAPEIRKAVSWIRDLPKFVVGNAIASSELEELPVRGAFRAKHPEFAGAPVALFLSRLHPKKGLDRLIPAWKKVAEKMPQVRLVLAGTGEPDYVSGLDRLIEANGLAGKVVRVGQLQGRAKWEALVDAEVFVLPSHQEGFSMAITEALGAGCACVITEECNFDDVREAGCGVVVSNGDMGAFVAGTMELLKDEGKRRAYGAKAQALIREKYTWEKIAEELEQVYRWVLAGKKLPASGEDIWR
jgi:glycosyltransferase involved in cell wall biosynthesis